MLTLEQIYFHDREWSLLDITGLNRNWIGCFHKYWPRKGWNWNLNSIELQFELELNWTNIIKDRIEIGIESNSNSDDSVQALIPRDFDSSTKSLIPILACPPLTMIFNKLERWRCAPGMNPWFRLQSKPPRQKSLIPSLIPIPGHFHISDSDSIHN